MNAFTEVQNYIRRMAALNPECDITMIDGNKGIEIYSIGDDQGFYLTYEEEGNATKFTRVKLLDKVNEFAVTKIKKTGSRAIVCANDQDVILAITDKPWELTKDQFKMIDYRGVLHGKKLTPSNLLITSISQGVTLFIEFKDEGGRIEQFACVLDSDHPDRIRYYPLACNFSTVDCSVAGRAVDQYVDGVYTYGSYGNTKQLLYTPSYNVFGDTQPAPIRLKDICKVESIGALKMKERDGTHLFATGDKGLYFYHNDMQKDMYHIKNADPVLMITSEYFTEVKKITPVLFDDKLYVYVLNESNILSYTYADYIQDEPSNFKEPVTMMDGVFYFDVSEDGTMNICTSNQAIFGKRNTNTGEWEFENACIETELDEYQTLSAYVTKITSGEPDIEVKIDSIEDQVIESYVNNIYHKFKSLTAKTDQTGCITIVQIANSFTPASFVVTSGSTVVEVNPAIESQKKILSLNDASSLKSEMITTPDGKEYQLFADTDDTNKNLIASSMASLNGAINTFCPGFAMLPGSQFVTGIIVKITDKLVSILPYDVTHNPFASFISECVSDIGYAFNWVIDKVKWLYDHTIKTAVDFIIGIENKVWKFVVKIGKKVLDVVLDTVESVFTAAKKLLELIGIPIDKIFDWLKKALGIDDVVKTNDTFKQMIQLAGKKLSVKAVEMKEDIIEKLDSAIDSVEKWANLSGSDAKKATGGIIDKKMGDLGFSLTPRNMYMFDTILGGINIGDITLPSFTMTSELEVAIKKLDQAIVGVWDGLSEVGDIILSIGDNIEGIFGSKDIFEVCDQLKQIVGKIAVAGLTACKPFIGLIFDVVSLAIEAIITLLCKPIHIPFVSEILKIFGINEFSIIDIITFPIAFFVTTITKITTGHSIISDSLYESIMNAETIDNIGRNTLLRAVNVIRDNEIVDLTSDVNELYGEGEKNLAVSMKIIMASIAYAEAIYSGAYIAIDATSTDGIGTIGKKIKSVVDVVCTLFDFGCSYVFGYHTFDNSPMDVDDNSQYSKNIKLVRVWNEIYTFGWWVKSIISLFTGTITIVFTFKKEEESKVYTKISDVIQIAVCGISAFAELAGDITAGVVTLDDTKYKDVEKDKKVYLCDTSGYLSDDIRSIIDTVLDFDAVNGLLKNPYVLVGVIATRATFALGYGLSMQLSGIYIAS